MKHLICYTFVNNNQYGFGRNIYATPALKIFEIATYSCRFSPCRDENLLAQNCSASEMLKIACSRRFLRCRHTSVWQREKSPNVRDMLYFRHMGLLLTKVYIKLHYTIIYGENKVIFKKNLIFLPFDIRIYVLMQNPKKHMRFSPEF